MGISVSFLKKAKSDHLYLKLKKVSILWKKLLTNEKKIFIQLADSFPSVTTSDYQQR